MKQKISYHLIALNSAQNRKLFFILLTLVSLVVAAGAPGGDSGIGGR